MKKLSAFCLLLCTLTVLSQSNRNQNLLQPAQNQRTCGTGVLPQQFEDWYQNLRAADIAAKGAPGGGGNTESIFNIPVVVHVVHNNEALNSINATSGGNLNAAQIVDQINILNRDYNGLNPDTASIPAVFKPVFAKFQVNFCLAVVNPTGGVMAEPGIDRINRVSKGWTAPPYTQSYIDATIKPNSIWDPNRYFNVWVMNLGGGLLGYATFPNPGGTGLAGLPAPYGSATTDGVVILNTAFGSIGTAVNNAPYNKGRTITHEAGHWMGLRHIWGDASCGNDYCNDTPTQSTSNFGCPNFPSVTCGNGPNGDMFMNYMDYVDDACMFMFTKDQKYRAQLILQGAPIRSSLITSTVCNLPTVGNDVGITYVANPTYSQIINCNNYFTPVINLRNFGSTTLTTTTIYYNVDGVNTQTVSWAGSLSPSTAVNYSLPVISNLTNGAHAFNATVTAPNGGTDNNANNNVNNQLFSITNSFTLSATSATICSGHTATLIGSGGATTYSWNPGAIAGATAVVSPTASTVYTLTGTTGTCSNTRTTNLTVNPTPTVTVNSYTICAGGTATLSASGATSYSWSNGANINPITVTPSVTTVYTTTGTAAGCSATANSTVTLGAALSIAMSPSVQTRCIGSSATITASGATSYTWSNGSNASSIVITPSINTTYSVIGTNGACSGSNIAVVNITPYSTVTVNSANALCFGQSSGTAGINATGGATPYTYSFSTGAVTQTVGSLATGNYTAIVTTSAGCVTTRTFAIGQPSPLNMALSGTNTTCGNCNGSLSYSATGGTPGYNFTVSPGGANNNLCAGMYSVAGTDANGCVMSSSVYIITSSGVSASASSTNASCGGCTDGSASVTVSGGTGPYTYSWSPSGGNAAQANNLSDGCYTVTVTDAASCTSTATTCVGIGTATGIKKNTQIGSFRFYPNPTDGKIFIEFTSASERKIELYDITGRIIIEQRTNDAATQLNIENLSNGVYYVQVKDPDGSRQFRIIKQ
jgi:hypothetical protein